MIRAKSTVALALVLCASLWACGGDGEGGNHGGSGGSGGTAPTECGNDVVEAGEECDDGNRTPGDGCDEFCKLETVVDACDGAIDFMGEATYQEDLGLRHLASTIGKDSVGQFTGSCGGAGQEVVFSYVTEGPGLLLWLVADSLLNEVTNVTSYILTACDETSEIGCLTNSESGLVELDRAGEFFIVVDSTTPRSEDFEIRLQTIFIPIIELGKACDPTGETNVCRTGLVCKGTTPTCQEGTAPEITRVLYANRGGDRGGVTLHFEGSDPDEDVMVVRLETMDENGTPKAYDLDGDGKLEASVLDADIPAAAKKGNGLFQTFTDFTGTVAPPQVAITVIDGAGLKSERRVLALAPMPWRTEDQSCDDFGFETCDIGFICKGEQTTTCHQGTSPAITRILYANRADRGGITLHFEGTDPDDDVVGYRLELMDENGDRKTYDIDGDSLQESATTVRDLSSTSGAFWNSMNFKTAVPQIAITVLDASGLESERRVLELAPMPWQPLGESCDGFGFESCDVGLICDDTTSVCVPGSAPVVDRASFHDDGEGPSLAVLVHDDDGDFTKVIMTLMDESGTPTAYDLEGKGELMGPVIDFRASGYFLCNLNVCVASLALLDGFKDIPRASFQAVDASGLTSEVYPVDYGPLPARESGETCDSWNLFDTCPDGDKCGGEFPTCMESADLKAQLCTEAETIEVDGPGFYSATGVIRHPNMWAAPTGCTTNAFPTPEGLVILRLENDASKVTLSTVNTVCQEGLAIGDTVLYVLPTACGEGTALGCNDDLDAENRVYGSQLVLNDLVAGDYTVVIDTRNMAVNEVPFQLDITVE